MNIQQAMLKAMAAISATGIGKTSSANLGGATVKYRGIEMAMNVMSPILIASGITVTARYSDLNITERAKAEGKATRFCTLKGTFTFAADDGSSVVAECYGEAMDSGDKATVKAQSVAFRTALFQQFVVPTMAMDPEADGDEEDDAEGSMLAEFREAAMGGVAELEKLFKARKPPAAFWKRHSDSLKAAAMAAAMAEAGAPA